MNKTLGKIKDNIPWLAMIIGLWAFSSSVVFLVSIFVFQSDNYQLVVSWFGFLVVSAGIVVTFAVLLLWDYVIMPFIKSPSE